ncbi:MAG: MaoC family dehydratase [Nitriliruptorales bacterium]|nr:MaoC family dehydratase [Nitriliruptorales bacterium]
MSVTLDPDQLLDAEDVELGTSDWLEVTQQMIDQFADATGDHQWIHVDPEKAANGPFGQTIAHGYLTVSLLPQLVGGMVEVPDSKMGINYGIDKMRLTAPVPSGSRVRAQARLKDAKEKGGGILYRLDVQVDIEDQERPALVGTVLYMVYT